MAEYPSYNHLVHYLFKRNYFFDDKRTKALEHLQLISDKGIEKLIKNIGTLKYLDKIPIRRSGDRIRYFFQFLTPSKFKGTGFLIAQKIK